MSYSPLITDKSEIWDVMRRCAFIYIYIYINEFPFKFTNIRRCGLVKGSNPREVATMIFFSNLRHNFFPRSSILSKKEII